VKPWVLILTSVVLGAAGQLAMKQGMSRFGAVLSLAPGVVWRMLWQPFVLVGLALYGVAAVLWLVVLSRVQLSVAYPMLALGYVIVLGCSWLVFHEPLSLAKVVAVLLICSGVVLLGVSA
jgi:multidrug transporter EmrE-like cation transporter